MKTIRVPAIITSIRSKVDRSLSMTLHTPELTAREKALFMDLQGVNTDLTIAPTDEVPVGEEKIDRELNTKTQSQRLRATLYVLWEQEGKQDSFDDFYRGKMESIIEWIKGKLD